MKKKILIAISFIVAVLILNFVGSFGYCRNWWGSNSFVMRSLWLCSCPAEFEHTLYPKYVDVVFSACDNISIRPVLDSDYYEVNSYDFYIPSDSYFWNPLTDEKIAFHKPDKFYDILNIELIYVAGRLISVEDGESVPIGLLNLDNLPPVYLPDGSINPDVVAKLFSDSTHIFTEPTNSNRIIVLGPDWLNQPNRNFIIHSEKLPHENETWLQDVIAASKHPTTRITRSSGNIPSYHSLISPDERFDAHFYGIDDAIGGKRVIDFSDSDLLPCPFNDCAPAYPQSFQPSSWLSDSSAVFYQSHRFSFIETYFGSLPVPSVIVGSPLKHLGTVPPVLKITVTNIEE